MDAQAKPLASMSPANEPFVRPSREEAEAAGWFGARVDPRVRGRIGDLLVACHGDLALYDGRRVGPRAFEMVGQHGAPTKAEREVPLLLWRR